MSKKENLRAAQQELEKNKGVSVRSVAKKFGVPPTTLQRHVNTESQIGAGQPTVLTHAEEREIVYSCQALQEMGFGTTRDMVGSIVVDYLSTVGRDNPFNGQPGYKWWKGFLQRFPQLVDRKAQHLPKHRAIAGMEATVQGFLAKVSDLLQSLNLTHPHSMKGYGIVMRVGSVHQWRQPQCLPEGEQSGSMKPRVGLDVRSPPSTWLVRHLGDACLHSLSIKASTCTPRGLTEAQQELGTA